MRDIFADNVLVRSVGKPPSIRSRYEFRLCVTPQALGLVSKAFGDADAILIETGHPDRSSAVEFKRVKISPSSFKTGELNKLKELRKAVRQANALHSAGFAHVWLTVIIVADVRPITNGTGFSFAPQEMVQRVINAIPPSKLANEVGVTVCQIAQVSDQPANFCGTAGGEIMRSATERAQSNRLTAAVAQLFSSPFIETGSHKSIVQPLPGI